MAKFCVKCGTPLGSGPFCVKCGADTRSIAQSVQSQPASVPAQSPQAVTTPATQAGPQPVITTPAAPAVGQPVGPKQGMSTLAKLGIAAVAIIFVGGAAGAVGVYYVAHKVSQKYHEVSDGILGSGSGSGSTIEKGSRDASAKVSSGANGSLGDVCRFLDKEDVSKAIGIEIVRTDPGDNGCTYIARGSQADMTAKHMKAMLADRGADAKSQEMAEKFAGGFFHAFAADKRTSEASQEASGEVPVFTFSVDQNSAEAQMRLNAKVLGNLGSQEGLPGIGDQAFVSADGMMFVRKGKSLVRIMYTTCPCGVEQVKPLAKEIADAL
jgi:hypothetical protein